jgi:hypothetical protein
MINKKDIVDAITLLKFSFPGALKDISESDIQVMVEIWYEDFKNTPKEDFINAINGIRYTSKYFPSIADIKERLAKKNVATLPSAEDEWQEVLKAVRRYGSYREEEALKSLKPYTSRIVRLIGYYRICTSTPEQQTWNRKEFIEEYNSLKDKAMENLQIGVSEKLMLNE